MRFALSIFVSVFTLSAVSAGDIKFTIRNNTQRDIKIDSSGLAHYAVSKSVPKEIRKGEETDAIISVKPEMFDISKKEKIRLFVADHPVTDIFIEFPKGSVLLSAVAHDISDETVNPQFDFVSDQVCGRSTKWKSVIRICSSKNEGQHRKRKREDSKIDD